MTKKTNILITGGTGTVGRSLLQRLLLDDAHNICIFSRDEQKQDALANEIGRPGNVSFVIGDIRDFDSLDSVMEGMDIVFHLAAMKIVRTCEANPYETFLTNITGTGNVIKSASRNRVKKVIFSSSDKAASPTCDMGISKLYCERLITHANLTANNRTVFSSIRFGNILGSRGSVVELFKKQIRHQNHVTLTHPDMSRFFISTEQSVDFLLKAADLSAGGEVFIDKMPSIRIYDLARVLIDYIAPACSKNPEEIEIKIIDKLPVEKIHEDIITAHETERAFEFPGHYCILPPLPCEEWKRYDMDKGKKVTQPISSISSEQFIGRNDILGFLLQNRIIGADSCEE